MDKVFVEKAFEDAKEFNAMRISIRAVKRKYNFSKYLLSKLEKQGRLLPIERNKRGERIYEEEDIRKFIDSLPSY